MKRPLGIWLVVACCWAGLAIVSPVARAEEPTAAMRARIDELLDQKWREAGVVAAPPASDAEFLRRVYLDLTGRIPRVSEARDFLADPRPDRRERLIDELVTRPDHVQHVANHWRSVLLPDNGATMQFGGDYTFTLWLRQQIAENKPYDKLVSDVILAKGQPGQVGPSLFYVALERKPAELAASTSRAFLGVQIQCAQCHNHPFDAWKQEDFWGFAAFFAHVQPANPQQGGIFGPLDDAKQGDVKHPTSGEVVPPKFLHGGVAEKGWGRTRRQQLAEWLTAPENPYFAKAAVNRVWGMLFGRGIVHPVDDMGEHNPPIHPELLDELARHFVATGYDLRGLVKTIAATKAYQLSSKGSPGSDDAERVFARMAIKSLTADQLYDCLATATAKRQVQQPAYYGNLYDPQRISFITKFKAPPGRTDEFHGGILQALTLMNGADIALGTDEKKSDLLGALDAPFFTDEQRVETLFFATLSREPTAAERTKCVTHVTQQSSPEDRRKALADVLWALLNTAEFGLNH